MISPAADIAWHLARVSQEALQGHGVSGGIRCAVLLSAFPTHSDYDGMPPPIPRESAALCPEAAWQAG